MAALFEHGLTCLIILSLLNGAYAKYCADRGKPENETIQICHEKILTANKVSIDSDGALYGGITDCRCTIESINQSSPLMVSISSYVEFDKKGIQFEIGDQKFSDIYPEKAEIKIDSITRLLFQRTSANTNSSICLTLRAVFSAELKVHCHSEDVYNNPCAGISKAKNQTIQVCHENIITADNVFIDSDGAPKGDNITCRCTVESVDKSYPQSIMTNSYVGNFDRKGLQFEIGDQEYPDAYDRRTDIVIHNTTSIVLRRTVADTRSSICLHLMKKGTSAEIKVQCYDHESMSSTDRGTVPVPDGGRVTVRGSSTKPPSNNTITDTARDESSSLEIAVVIAVVACVATVACAVIFLIIWRRRNKRTSLKQTNTVAQEDDEADIFTTENIHYESAEGQADSTSTPKNEQQCLLRGNVEKDPGDAYTEIGTFDKMDFSSHVSVKEDGQRPNTQDASNNILPEEPGAHDGVYNSSGNTCTAARPTQTENVYNTVVRENDYNCLNEVLDAKIVSANIYGTASGDINN